MKIVATPLPGVVLLEPSVFSDHRGYFFETFHADKLPELGIPGSFVQINNSFSKAGVLRGMHFQRHPKAQTKLVRAIRGRLFDAVIDIRKDSPTFGQSFGVELNDENRYMLYVPAGFAHGFYSITDCEMQYLVGGANYHKDSEGGVRWNDPVVKIDWPIVGEPIVHERDASFPMLGELEITF